jgi:hypothetical protein
MTAAGGKRSLRGYAHRMDLELARLAKDVQESVDAYAIPHDHPADALGEPLSAQWYEAGLAEMRASLVSPYWLEIRDLDPDTGKLVVLKVAVVAEPGDGSVVAFDPRSGGEFVAALRELDTDRERAVDAVSCGLRGDAVGCFLSR